MPIQRGGLEGLRGGLGQVRVPLGSRVVPHLISACRLMLPQLKIVPRLIPGRGMSQCGQSLVQSVVEFSTCASGVVSVSHSFCEVVFHVQYIGTPWGGK